MLKGGLKGGALRALTLLGCLGVEEGWFEGAKGVFLRVLKGWSEGVEGVKGMKGIQGMMGITGISGLGQLRPSGLGCGCWGSEGFQNFWVLPAWQRTSRNWSKKPGKTLNGPHTPVQRHTAAGEKNPRHLQVAGGLGLMYQN